MYCDKKSRFFGGVFKFDQNCSQNAKGFICNVWNSISTLTSHFNNCTRVKFDIFIDYCREIKCKRFHFNFISRCSLLFHLAKCSIFSRVSTSSYGDWTLKAYIGRDEPSCHAREVFLDIDRCCLEETLYRLSRISFEDKARARLRFDIEKFREILRSRC